MGCNVAIATPGMIMTAIDHIVDRKGNDPRRPPPFRHELERQHLPLHRLPQYREVDPRLAPRPWARDAGKQKVPRDVWKANLGEPDVRIQSFHRPTTVRPGPRACWRGRRKPSCSRVGHTLIPTMKASPRGSPSHIVDMTNIEGLTTLKTGARSVTIGAMNPSCRGGELG